MKLSDFEYELPAASIAQHPLEPRDHSRLMVLNRKSGTVEHRYFFEIADFVNPGDLMVFNDSRVFSARLKGNIEGSERQAELLLLKRLGGGKWEALVRPAKKLVEGSTVILFSQRLESFPTIMASILEKKDNGLRIVSFSDETMLDNIGEVPLPPYIKTRLENKERYQTVYAKEKGSAAAPTAGLHFTTALLSELKQKRVNMAFITLHIGLDTFQPVRSENPEHHHIHSEFGRISADAVSLIQNTKKTGGRVIAVGTTSVRLIEAASKSGAIQQYCGPVDLFILPGYRFITTDAIITNFHLPRSTLLMMISAFAGREFILDAYNNARRIGYRFYSFGDAMLIT